MRRTGQWRRSRTSIAILRAGLTSLSQRADAIESLDGIRISIVAVTSERNELGFNDAESVRARAALTDANEADRQAMAHLHLAQTAARERQTELKSLRDQEQRYKQQLERSAALLRNANELGEMYKEFGIFDQYVAARIAPRLAEQTSQLLEIATDGKFSSVEFDEKLRHRGL